MFSGLISVAFSTAGDAALVIILVGSLLGSFINIPLYKIKSNQPLVREEYIRWFGITYRIPRVALQETYTEVDVNVGGALLPAGMSIFLLTISSNSIVLYSLIGVLAVTIVTHLVARPVRGVGIETQLSFHHSQLRLSHLFFLQLNQQLLLTYQGRLGRS